jgi:hypothetical protein
MSSDASNITNGSETDKPEKEGQRDETGLGGGRRKQRRSRVGKLHMHTLARVQQSPGHPGGRVSLTLRLEYSIYIYDFVINYLNDRCSVVHRNSWLNNAARIQQLS